MPWGQAASKRLMCKVINGCLIGSQMDEGFKLSSRLAVTEADLLEQAWPAAQAI